MGTCIQVAMILCYEVARREHRLHPNRMNLMGSFIQTTLEAKTPQKGLQCRQKSGLIG